MRYDRRRILQAGLGWGVGWAARGVAPAAAAALAPAPKTNQLGFSPQASKRFCWATVDHGFSADRFVLEDDNGRNVFQGPLGPPADQSAWCGEQVCSGDFSVFAVPGRYRVAVGAARSHPFAVVEGPYRALLRDAARAFFLIRANVAIDDPVSGLRHRAGHAADAALPMAGGRRDLSGGWYNAGDFGKWTAMAAISASHMMWLQALRPAAKLDLNLPKAYPRLPDLLEQARWGLEWLLKMQNADGSVLHKVDSEPNLPWGVLPENDRSARAARGAWSKDAGVFVGAMAQAARAFLPYDAAFAQQCRQAAELSWQWLEEHPAVDGRDPYYAGDAIWPKTLWALCAMADLTDDATLMDRAAGQIALRGVRACCWPLPHLLGVFALARPLDDPKASRAARKATAIAIDRIRVAARQIVSEARTDAYGYSANRAAYVWGSVEYALDAANLCLLAAEIDRDPALRGTAARLIDYVLGNNSLGRCFVTGHGTSRIERPYHWACRTLGLVFPGWAVGGPNGVSNGADPLLAAVIRRGTPPAQCHVDACGNDGSWASNEGQTSENAALILALGLYDL